MTTEENQTAVRLVLKALRIEMAEERIPALAESYAQVIAQSHQLRESNTPVPTAPHFDASWSEN